MQAEDMFALMFVTGMFAGVFVIFMAMRQRTSQLEMQHREKMAMIERGLTPDRTLGPQAHLGPVLRDRMTFASRSVTIGVVLIGVGLGFMSLVGIAGGAPQAGIGIGGAVGIIGVAFIVNGLISKPGQQQSIYEYPQNQPKPPVDPAV